MRKRMLRPQPMTLLLAAALCLAALIAPNAAPAAALGQREVLPNGMILLVAEQRSAPIVTLSIRLQAGSILDPAGKPGVANLVAQLMTQGTKTRTAPQISEAIEFVGASLGVDAGQEQATISPEIGSASFRERV